ncbi:MAG TPA: hypothetical protein VL025_06565, partial [Thermoanaerobaculia bacterium]|nr:hypothetical protein [Thermoanaerobaculia bacterium]
MIRRFVAQLLIGFVLIGSSPGPASIQQGAHPVARLVEAPAFTAETVPPPAAPEEIFEEVPPPESRGEGLAEGDEIQVLPLDVQTLQSPASMESAPGAPLQLLDAASQAVTPGIQEAGRRSVSQVQEVRPPMPPQAVVAHAPDIDVADAAAATAEERALPALPRLTVHPSVLRFALTAGGTTPAAQRLEIASDRREGARFEVSSPPGWLLLSTEGGRAGLAGVAVQVAVDGRRISGPLSGQVEVRNLDDPSDVRRIAVEVERAGSGRPLRSYDADGRLQRVVRPDGGILDYDYDGQGRLVRVRRPDGSAVTWSYDDQGRRIAMTDGRGTTVYRYDAQGRLDALYSPGFEPVRYGYDEQSRLTTLTLPGGRVVAWEYDEADRLLSVRSDLGTTRYTYDAATRRLAERALPNGVVTRYGYDGAGRLTEVAHQDAAGQPLLSFAWSLDEQGRPVSVTREGATGRETTDVAYDEAGRIVSAALPDGRRVTWEYDTAGRRSRETVTRGAS